MTNVTQMSTKTANRLRGIRPVSAEMAGWPNRAPLLPFLFPAVSRKKVTAAFDGGRITSDDGVLLLAEADRRLGLGAIGAKDRRAGLGT